MKRTRTQLADGRELFYFDESDTTDRGAPDRRRLPELPPPAELRYDPLLDEWVAIATHRQDRVFLPAAADCPLCPSTAGRSTEIPAAAYDVAVFENRFPSFRRPDAPPRTLSATESHPGLPGPPAVGRCEVVAFTDRHDGSFAQLSTRRMRTVLEAWIDRTAELSTLDGVEQVFCFENRGEQIGVTLHHPHGQIYAYPYITPRTRTMLAAARKDPEVFARELDQAGDRIVGQNEHWVAFVPFASRWPYEVRIMPRRRVPDLPALSPAERDTFGPLYRDVLRRFDGLFDQPMPYIAGWHQAPVRVGRELAHLHLQVFSLQRAPGKMKYLAGSESAMGAFINDVRPEEAARLLRGVSV